MSSTGERFNPNGKSRQDLEGPRSSEERMRKIEATVSEILLQVHENSLKLDFP